jgi:hypothetical protein
LWLAGYDAIGAYETIRDWSRWSGTTRASKGLTIPQLSEAKLKMRPIGLLSVSALAEP